MKIYTESEMYEMYEDYLDEVYGDVIIASYEFSTSRALKELDEVAYRCGFNDWLDSEGYEECGDGWITEDDKEKVEEMEEIARGMYCPECLKSGDLEYDISDEDFLCHNCKKTFDESELLTEDEATEKEEEK